MGIVFGKNYIFQVIEYLGKKPQNTKQIKWELTYHDLDDNEWKVLPVSNTGETCTINMSNVDTCGRYIYIRAYINDSKNDAVLKIWKHNRFKWFDSKKLYSEIENRKRDAWKIDQDNTNTCGPSSIMYVFAKKFPDKYEKFIFDLHRKGISQHNNYIINIDDKDNLKKIAETNPNKMKYFPKNMAYSDWIPNTCITAKENKIFAFEGNSKEDYQSITLPSRMVKLSKELLGYDEIIDNTNLFFNKSGWVWGATMEDIADLIQAKENGFEIFLFIGVNMIKNKITDPTFATPEHWIVLETIKQGDLGSVEMTIYTWGQEPTTKYNLSYDVFRTNYYGFIKVK